MYLTNVPQDAEVTLISGSHLDGVDAFFDMFGSAEQVSKERAVEVLHNLNMCAYHPDVHIIAIYDGFECHPIIDAVTSECTNIVTMYGTRNSVYDFCEYWLTERLHVWPDGTYCGDEDLEQYLTFCSDDYASYGPTK